MNRPSTIAKSVALRVVLPFCAGYFLSYIFRTVNSVIAPNLSHDLSLPADRIGFLTSVYFLTFAAAQLPLGLALDRFGPKRVEALLLMVAALGCGFFAFSSDWTGLAVGRALIGVGVSACMMAAFKAFVMWFPPERLPWVNSVLLALGSAGALAATLPVEYLLASVSWRELFMGLMVLSVLIGVLVFRVVPDHEEPPLHTSFGEQWLGLTVVFRDRFFWRVVPLTALSQAAFLSVQGLWAGPWLRDVVGLGRESVAWFLGGQSLAIVVGFVGIGALTDRLVRRGVPLVRIAGVGMAGFALVYLGMALFGGEGAAWMVFGFGLLGTTGTLPYALLSQYFPRHLAGRANTGLNVLVFSAAFGFQWAIGAVLHIWEDAQSFTYEPIGYAWAFGALAVFQLGALLVFPWRSADHQ